MLAAVALPSDCLAADPASRPFGSPLIASTAPAATASAVPASARASRAARSGARQAGSRSRPTRVRHRVRRIASPPRSSKRRQGAVASTANVTGGLAAGCDIFSIPPGGIVQSRNAPLPFPIDFLGRTYYDVNIDPMGFVYFDGGNPQMWVSSPTNTRDDYRVYPSRLIAPFFSWGTASTPSGGPTTTWGQTTFNGHNAFCVQWQGWANYDQCVSNHPWDPSKTNTMQMLLVQRDDAGYEDFDIVFLYDQIQWDNPGVDPSLGGTGDTCGDPAGAGWKTGYGDGTLIPGAFTSGAYLDSSPTGLIHGSIGSSDPGTYVWPIRNGRTAPAVPPGQGHGPPGGGSDPWGENPSGGQGDPVNSASGSYYTAVTDLSLPGVGVPFSLTRTYNSLDVIPGRLGSGWTDNLNASLFAQPNGDVLARSPEGQQVLFVLQPDGGFTPPAGGRATLSAIADGHELVTSQQVRYRFDAQGRLVSARDRNGQGLVLTHGTDGTLATARDSADRTISFSYVNGLLSEVTLPDGRATRYGYDANGRLETVTDVRGAITKYTYDPGGRLASIVDQNDHVVVRNTYDADGRVAEQLDANAGMSRFAWDPATQTSTYTDPRGKAWRDVYSGGALIDRIDPRGARTHFAYDGGLNVTDVRDPLGNHTTMTYDDRGNLLTRTAADPLAYKQTWTYNSVNDVETYKDGRGAVRTYGYDGAGNLTSITAPDPDGPASWAPLLPPVTQFGRDPGGSGLLASITDPRGKLTSFGHDPDGNLASITSPLGGRTTIGYDPSGRRTDRVEPRGNVQGADPNLYRTTFSYDDADNLLTETDPLDNRTSYSYDAAGNLATVTDALNRVTRYDYDAADQLRSVTAPGDVTTGYDYDAVGNLTKRTDANDHSTRYDYDEVNRLISRTTAGGRLWTYAYDNAGNRTRMTDANGNATSTAGDGITTYLYNEVNRLRRITYSSSPADNVSVEYDANGNRTYMTDAAGSRTYDYDALDRPLRANGIAYGYDAGGNIVQRDFSDGSQVRHSYDDDGRLQSVTSGAATTAYGYDAAGRLVTTTLPATNGYVKTQSYDHAGRLSGVRHAKGASVLADSVITRDRVANPLSIVQSGATASTSKYTYDARDRLTEVCYQAAPCTAASSPFIRWTYDAVGNRRTQARPSATATTSSYDVDDRLLSAGATTYGYDANGNQTSAGATTYVHDGANRMQSTKTGRTTTTYKYDGDGLRRSASTGTQTAQTTSYEWDTLYPEPEIVRERDGAGKALRGYVYGHGRIAMSTYGSSAASFYYHHDHLGSVTNLTSATGATQWTHAYEPFGAIRTETKNATKAPVNAMKFTGQQLDATGLYHLRARQYDPQTGRFLSPDPYEAPTGSPQHSAYSYVDGRPTVYTDPSGLCFLPCALVGAVANTAVYVVSTVAKGEDLSLKDGLQAAAEGAVTGAAGGVGGNALKRAFGLLKSGAKPAAAASASGVAGGAVTQARSLAAGCGPASVGSMLRGAGVTAAGSLVGGAAFPTKSADPRLLKDLGRNQHDHEKLWHGAYLGSIVEAAAQSNGGGCGPGRNGK